MAIVVLLAVDINFSEGTIQFYTVVAFIIGCYTSILSGWIGMKIAVYANIRTAFEAQYSKTTFFPLKLTPSLERVSKKPSTSPSEPVASWVSAWSRSPLWS